MVGWWVGEGKGLVGTWVMSILGNVVMLCHV